MTPFYQYIDSSLNAHDVVTKICIILLKMEANKNGEQANANHYIWNQNGLRWMLIVDFQLIVDNQPQIHHFHLILFTILFEPNKSQTFYRWLTDLANL